MKPETTLAELRRHQRRWLIAGVIVIASSPAVWVGTVLLGMWGTFHTIETTANPSPDELAPGIYVAMLGPITSGIVALAGAALVLWAIRRKRWLDEIESELEADPQA